MKNKVVCLLWKDLENQVNICERGKFKVEGILSGKVCDTQLRMAAT